MSVDLTSEEVEDIECLKCRGVIPSIVVGKYAKCLNCGRISKWE